MPKFSDVYIRSLQPTEKRYIVREAQGFAIRIYPSGQKSWVYIYDWRGRRRTLFLGSYPAITLAEARKRYREACDAVALGRDPARDKQAAKDLQTVGDLADDYLAEWAKPNKKSWREDQRIINNDIKPAFAAVQINELRRRDVTAWIKRKAKTSPNQAWQTLKILRRMFNYALEQDIDGLDANPCSHIKLPTPAAKERTLTWDEIAVFWQGCTPADSRTVPALRMILLTGQRPGEVSGMHRREIDGNWWTIPAERSKNKRPTRVYLTSLALEQIGARTGYIFPGVTREDDPEKPLSDNALTHYLRRTILGRDIDKRIKGESGRKRRWYAAQKATEPIPEKNRLGIPYFTAHDLRRTAATRWAEIGIQPHIIAQLLNHTDRSVTGRHYNLYSYDAEKKAALLLWETSLKTRLG